MTVQSNYFSLLFPVFDFKKTTVLSIYYNNRNKKPNAKSVKIRNYGQTDEVFEPVLDDGTKYKICIAYVVEKYNRYWK